MKITYTLFAVVIAAIGFTTNAKAQSAVTSTATATLIIPISIEETSSMNFGSLAASAVEGTAVLTPAGGLTATPGVTIAAGGAPVTPAAFTVTGEGTNGFDLTFPASIALTSPAIGALPLALAITCDASTEVSSSQALVGGTKVLNFGGTLTIPANAVAGTYTNDANFTVSVQYN